MKRVLQITTCNCFRGIEKQELELFKNIDNIIYDFLTPTSSTFKDYKKEIESLGGKVYDLNINRNSLINKLIYGSRLKKFLKKNKYDIIHINSSAFFFMLQVSLIAKKCKVKKIIIHTHSIRKINKIKNILIRILNSLLINITNEHLSCSKETAKAFYNKKYLNNIDIINNGIEIDKYKFNLKIREEYRNKLNLNDKVVYGHVGQFDKRKNHTFLIDIFYEITKIQENAILILIGEGKLLNNIKEKVNKLGISNKVLFLGFRNNLNEFLNCMDIFIFPSIMEGLGIAVIEAQTNGIITFCSNAISKSANISPYLKKFNLNDRPSTIAKNILNTKDTSIFKRKNAYRFTQKNGYDIKDSSKILKQIYLR